MEACEFKVGDKVVCVDNNNATNLYNLNQTYTIERIVSYGDNEYLVKVPNRIFTKVKRFVSLKEYIFMQRKLKLKKLNEKG